MKDGAAVLDTVVADLWRRAAGQPPRVHLPIRVFGQADAVREVLTRHGDFSKNYAFLTDLAVGRQSVAGGAAWEARAQLTRHWFHGRAVDDAALEAAYADAFAPALAAGPLGTEGLFDLAVEAGIAVFSRQLGLAHPLPWPRALAHATRALLARRQIIGWQLAPAGELQALKAELIHARESWRALWRADAVLAARLDVLQAAGQYIDGFDAVQELLLGAMASSETTAASLLWCVELLGRHPQQAQLLDNAAGMQAFIAEALRLFPPVPFMTRVSTGAHRIGEVELAPGEHLAVSLVGVHCDPALWPRPMAFEPQRWLADELPSGADWLPFSRGQRVCAGMALAKRELSAALAWVHANARVEPGTEPPVMRFAVSLRPQSNTRLMQRCTSRLFSCHQPKS